jgi:hypothetical protein
MKGPVSMQESLLQRLQSPGQSMAPDPSRQRPIGRGNGHIYPGLQDIESKGFFQTVTVITSWSTRMEYFPAVSVLLEQSFDASFKPWRRRRRKIPRQNIFGQKSRGAASSCKPQQGCCKVRGAGYGPHPCKKSMLQAARTGCAIGHGVVEDQPRIRSEYCRMGWPKLNRMAYQDSSSPPALLLLAALPHFSSLLRDLFEEFSLCSFLCSVRQEVQSQDEEVVLFRL